ncbi:MAG: hypothetical protein PHQ40_00350 [Anaerolineaceae bacterium]|nr:hypothetical protein [Anaerolineaceae bacterium]MDD5367506.1 hypothetical protein [Anaerolineaceae bacterium]
MISLRLFSRLTQANPPAFIADLTGAVGKTWKRSIRSLGGFWMGSFTLTGTAAELAGIFYENLGCHVEERSGGFITWEGLFYEMELQVGGMARRRSLSVMANHVTAKYLDSAGVAATTAPVQSERSIAEYGRREELLLLDGFDAAAVEARRDTHLVENAWPWARTVGVGPGDPKIAKLTVDVAGYVFTANWRYLSALTGEDTDVAEWIGAITAAYCEFLHVGSIRANSLAVKMSSTTPARAWDKMAEITALGDAGGAPWRLFVDQGRFLNYQKIETAPAYSLRGGQLVAISGEDITSSIDPWRLRPGVVRDMDYPVKKNEFGAWLSDARDFYVSEVEVSMADEKPVLKTELFDESQILAAQNQYRKQLEREAKK